MAWLSMEGHCCEEYQLLKYAGGRGGKVLGLEGDRVLGFMVRGGVGVGGITRGQF